MRTLALDLATHTGYAYRPDNVTVRFGTWDLSLKRYNLPGARFVRFESKLTALHAQFAFMSVVFEDVTFSTDTRATQVWGGFLAILQAWCDRRQVRYSGVHVATLKKFATGRGNAKKPDMIAAAKARGWNVADDNQADAVWLLDYARTNLTKGSLSVRS